MHVSAPASSVQRDPETRQSAGRRGGGQQSLHLGPETRPSTRDATLGMQKALNKCRLHEEAGPPGRGQGR